MHRTAASPALGAAILPFARQAKEGPCLIILIEFSNRRLKHGIHIRTDAVTDALPARRFGFITWHIADFLVSNHQ